MFLKVFAVRAYCVIPYNLQAVVIPCVFVPKQ